MWRQEAQRAVVTRCGCGVSVQYDSKVADMCGRKHGGFSYFGARPQCCNCVLQRGLCNMDEYRGDACTQCRRRADEQMRREVSAEPAALAGVVVPSVGCLVACAYTRIAP